MFVLVVVVVGGSSREIGLDNSHFLHYSSFNFQVKSCKSFLLICFVHCRYGAPVATVLFKFCELSNVRSGYFKLICIEKTIKQ